MTDHRGHRASQDFEPGRRAGRAAAWLVSVATSGIIVTGCVDASSFQRSTEKASEHVSGRASAGLEIDDHGQAVMLKSPTTLPELLINLKLAFDRNLFQLDEFWTEEALARLTGGRSVQFDRRAPPELWAAISQFGDIAAPMPIGGGAVPGLSLRIGRLRSKDGKPAVWLDLSVTSLNSNGSFERVTGIFGPDWQRDIHYVPPMGRVYQTPSAVMGNARIQYVAINPKEKRRLILEFQADGTLRSLEFQQMFDQ